MLESPAWVMLAPLFLFAAGGSTTSVEKVQLTIATLHAAALTTPRVAGDSTDAPFFLVEIVGPHNNSASILPRSAQPNIRLNEAVGARPLTELTLAQGDSVSVLVSVLENAKVPTSAEGAAAVTGARSASPAELSDHAKRLVAPLVKAGANWIGSVNLLLTNENGAIFWRRLDCVASCSVLTGPATTALPASAAQPSNGVVEFSGNGGTYHLALQAARAQ